MYEEVKLKEEISELQLFILSKSDRDGMINGTDGKKLNAASQCNLIEDVVKGKLALNYLTRNFGIRARVKRIKKAYEVAQNPSIFMKGHIVKNQDRAIYVTEDMDPDSTSFKGVLLWHSPFVNNEVGQTSDVWAADIHKICKVDEYKLVQEIRFVV